MDLLKKLQLTLNHAVTILIVIRYFIDTERYLIDNNQQKFNYHVRK